MVFSESLKIEVKKKAHYKCCICHSFGPLHIHHIIPQENGGPDTFDNAAPLCVRCHDNYGGNPEKRKWIKEKRGFWYDHCEKNLSNEDLNKLDRFLGTMENMQQEIGLLKSTISGLTEKNSYSGGELNIDIFLNKSLYPSLGPDNAKPIVIELVDFQCPYCALATGIPSWTPQYLGQYGDLVNVAKKVRELANKGEIRFIYVPLSFLGQESIDAAQAALCANEQGKFWQMYDTIYEASTSPMEDTGRYSKENLKIIAKNISGLDLVKFNTDLDNDKYLPSLQKITQVVSEQGIQISTPQFFVNGQSVPPSWSVLKDLLKN